MKTYKRPLTERHASLCEKAKHARCTCRCGGRFHGGDHHPYMQAEVEEAKRDYDRYVREGFVLTAEEVARLVRRIAGLPGIEEQVAP